MIACIFCIRKIDSWNVEVFFVVVRTCGLYKTLPASKIAKCPYDSPALTCAEGAKTRTHEEYSVLPLGCLSALSETCINLPRTFRGMKLLLGLLLVLTTRKCSVIYLLMFGIRIISPDTQAHIR